MSKVKADAVEVNAESLAKKTVGFLGAQIANMVNQAAIKAARDNACESVGGGTIAGLDFFEKPDDRDVSET